MGGKIYYPIEIQLGGNLSDTIRLEVKLGITGLWQLSDKTKEPIQNNLEYDLDYIKNQSLILDLKILPRTFFILFKMLYIVSKGCFAIKIN